MIPKGFLQEMEQLLGADEAARLHEALLTEPSVALRLNPHKPAPLPALDSAGEVEWCPGSLRLKERPLFTLMPQLHAGAFYVQDPSSMILRHVVSAIADELGNAPLVMLDACAAPGGKSTCALDALPAGSLLVANEFDPRRARILAENITKWGAPNCIVTQGDTSRFEPLREAFDIILVDAPCSGEGMMRKEEAARLQWSEGLVKQCAALQREILDNIWEALRPGGFLIYSTCTFNSYEDEEQVRYLMEQYGAENQSVPVAKEWRIASSRLPSVQALRFMPHITEGEGLFLAVVRKPGEYSPKAPVKMLGKANNKKKQKVSPAPAQLMQYVKNPGELEFFLSPSGEWSALPKIYIPLYEQLTRLTSVLQAGVTIATEKGRDLIPSHSLALSTVLAPEAFPRVELTEQEALTYLRREPLNLPPSTPRGYVIVTRGSLPIGFMKNLGIRANILYPAPWRIRLKQ